MKTFEDLNKDEWEEVVNVIHRLNYTYGYSVNNIIHKLKEMGYDINDGYIISLTECPTVFDFVETANYLKEGSA